MTELYKQFRPASFKDVIGQDHVIDMLKDFGKRQSIPHAILFSGPSGTGKTTIARILKEKMKCSDIDWREYNAANARGIDTAREIQSGMMLSPIDGRCKIYLLDECHQWTRQAQESLLKPLEDTPKHVYFFLATTDTQKIITAIKTRCTELKLKSLSASDLTKVVTRVAQEIKSDLSDRVMRKIVEVADGSPRMALNLFDKIQGIETEDEQLSIVESGSSVQAIELARALINPSKDWPAVAKILEGLRGEDSEQLRYMVLGYCGSVVLKSNGKTALRASQIMDRFLDNFYDSKYFGLISACYDVMGE